MITIGSTYNCLEPLQANLKSFIILLNKDDIDSFTVSSDHVSNITLKTGKVGYLFRCIRGSVKAQYKAVAGRKNIYYQHNVKFNIYDISATQKANLERMGKADMVAITFSKNSIGNNNSWFEIYGLNAGLSIIESKKSSLESSPAFSVVLATSEKSGESLMPYTYFNTDYDTSYSDLVALIISTSVGIGVMKIGSTFIVG